MNPEIAAINSGEFEKRLADAAGIINKAVIRSTPTSFNDTAITAAITTIKIIFIDLVFMPSAKAKSLLTVAANNERHIKPQSSEG